MSYLLLAVGIVLLLVCGDALVRGAVALSVKLGIPTLVIGLTIVAFGTSAPELVVSLRAALAGAPGMAIGNVVGSNIANVLLVLGLPAIIIATDTKQDFIVRNTVYVIIASLIFIALCFMGPLVFWHGALLFVLLVGFLLEQARRAEQHKDAATVLGEEAMEMIDDGADDNKSNLKILAFLLAGIVGLPFAAHITVEGASDIARQFNVPDETIGLTLLALGTSLPELATTLTAAIRGHAALALGNVLGSNLFNLLAVMGVTAMVAPVPVPEIITSIDLWVMLAATVILLPYVLGGREICRVTGSVFLTAYIAYIYFVFTPRTGAAGGAVEASTMMIK
ncbi:MAG: calcium/sodium antiporter [bacterium]|nr:calcium/sodium antiporter [bacterium]